MGMLTVLAYLLTIGLGFFPIWWTVRLRKSFPQKFLSRYQDFLLIYSVIVFSDLIIRFMSSRLGIIPETQTTKLDMLFGFLFVPLMALLGYLFVSFVLSLLNRSVPRRFLRAYVIFWLLFLATFLIVEAQFFRSSSLNLTGVLMCVFDTGILLLYAGTCIFLYIRSQAIRPAWRILLARGMALYYGAVTIFIFLSRSTLLPVLRLDQLSVHVLSLAFNIPPVLFLARLMKKRSKGVLTDLQEGGFQAVCVEHNITEREKDIIRNILKGKSNKEIVDALIISEKTVETHIYNIYRKLGVRNRIQLMNLFRACE